MIPEHYPIVGLSILAAVYIELIREVGLLGYPETAEPIQLHYLFERIGLGAEYFTGYFTGATPFFFDYLHYNSKELGIPIDLFPIKAGHPVIVVSFFLFIELILPNYGVFNEGGMIRHHWGGEKTSAVLYRAERVILTGFVDPWADQAVGMIQAQSVKFIHQFFDPLPEKTDGSSW
jgi:hypothetical protein